MRPYSLAASRASSRTRAPEDAGRRVVALEEADVARPGRARRVLLARPPGRSSTGSPSRGKTTGVVALHAPEVRQVEDVVGRADDERVELRLGHERAHALELRVVPRPGHARPTSRPGRRARDDPPDRPELACRRQDVRVDSVSSDGETRRCAGVRNAVRDVTTRDRRGVAGCGRRHRRIWIEPRAVGNDGAPTWPAVVARQSSTTRDAGRDLAARPHRPRIDRAGPGCTAATCGRRRASLATPLRPR